MKEYEVYGHATIICSMRLKANSKKEAIEKANEEFGGLSNYVGMGGTDKLLGVQNTDYDQSVLPDADPEFDDCREVK